MARTDLHGVDWASSPREALVIMANAHYIVGLSWEALFDFEAWDHDSNVEVGQRTPSSARTEHVEEEVLERSDQHTAEVTGQTSASGPGFDRDADVADLRMPMETLALGDQEMTMTDIGALQSLPGQRFPNTLTLPDQITPVNSEEHVARSGRESSAFPHASLQPGEIQDFQMPLEALTLARKGLSLGTSALQSETYRLGTAAAMRRSGTVQLDNDYDDIAAVKQSAKNWVKRMLQVYDQPVSERPPQDMAPELFLAVQRHYYQATVNLLRNRYQYHAENCMYLLLDAVTDANHHGPRFCQFGYTPDLTSICSERLQCCMDLMASDWVVRLRVLEQLALHSFAASPQEYARGVQLAAVTEMQAQEAVGRGECVPS
nr:hypothetical protein B0A51_17652 [Rachicladosporium sp. CCFEE 5018]